MNTSNQEQDTPMTMATIQAFRRMLDVMEEFIRNTEQERLNEHQGANQGKMVQKAGIPHT